MLLALRERQGFRRNAAFLALSWGAARVLRVVWRAVCGRQHLGTASAD